MPPFKSLSLEIRDPGRQKRELMDNALLSYTRALEHLLRHCREAAVALARTGRHVTRAQVQALADKDALRALNAFGVQPFKDSLKQDFITVLLSFIGRWQKTGGRTGYPRIRLEPEEADAQIHSLTHIFDMGGLSAAGMRARLATVLSHCGSIRPLYFGRYAAERDYCLLYDPKTGRFFAKLHLLNAQNRLPAPPAGRELVVVAPGLPPARVAPGLRRFIVVPLSFGKEQQKVLRQALETPQILRTARLIRVGDTYRLVLSVEVISNACVVTQTTLGVARSADSLTCTVCDSTGKVLENTRLTPDGSIFSLAKEITAHALKTQAQVVMEADGGRGDSLILRGRGSFARMTVFPAGEYTQLGYLLRYKLPEVGLPPPVFLSGIGLNITCPRCGAVTGKNRLSPQMFACVSCGYVTPFAFVGSRNLAVRLKKYESNKVPVYVREEDGIRHYFNNTLGFSCDLPAGQNEAPVFYELSLMAKSPQETWCEGKKYAMLCKLRAAEHICDAVRWVPVK